MKNKILILIITLLISSCTLQYNVISKNYNGIDVNFTVKEVVFYKDWLVNIGIQKVYSRLGNQYMINLVYVGSSWLFLDGKISIKADNKIIRIKDESPHRLVLHNATVMETVRATISKEDLDLIRKAKVVKIQYFGEPVRIDQNGISFINRFYNETI